VTKYTTEEAIASLDQRRSAPAPRPAKATKDKGPAEPAEPKRYTVAEALQLAADRRDERMGRPVKTKEERDAEAAERAAAIVDEVSDDTEDRYTSMEFADLQQEAKRRELNAGGSADAIRARLREADAPTAPPAEETAAPAADTDAPPQD
jgi:hypothetical protein